MLKKMKLAIDAQTVGEIHSCFPWRPGEVAANIVLAGKPSPSWYKLENQASQEFPAQTMMNIRDLPE